MSQLGFVCFGVMLLSLTALVSVKNRVFCWLEACE